MKTKAVNDMYLCAALINYGYALDRIDDANKKRLVFYFVDIPLAVWKLEHGIVSRIELVSIDQVELLYQSDQLMFLPTYHDSVRKTKSIIHSKR